MSSPRLFCVMLCCVFSTMNSDIRSAVIHVPADQANIQAGIYAAVDGDTVLLADGTYTGTGNRDVNITNKSVHVISQNGAASCIMDCQGSPGYHYAAFEISGTGSDGTVLSGIEMRNAFSNNSGAIALWTTSPLIQNCIFRDNTADVAGAIYCFDASPAITGCEFINNSASSGGAIKTINPSSNPLITSCVFSGNTAILGGAIYWENGNPVIGGSPGNGNYFIGNRAAAGADLCAYGTGVILNASYNTFAGFCDSDYYVSPIARFDLTGCISEMTPVTQDVFVAPYGMDTNNGLSQNSPFLTIHHAFSHVYGTPAEPITIHLVNGTYSPSATGEFFPLPMVSYVSITGENPIQSILDAENTSMGVYSFHDENVFMNNVTMTGASGGYAGGVYSFNSGLTVNNSIFTGNSGDFSGGICIEASTVSLQNCLMRDNNCLYNGGGLYAWESVVQINNCTFTSNLSPYQGGGISAGSNTYINIIDSIFWGNTAPSGSNLAIYSSGNLSLNYCDVEGGAAGIPVPVEGSLTWGVGMIETDPLFEIGPGGDYYLAQTAAGQLSDSPCINTGSDLSANTCYTVESHPICLSDLVTRTDIVTDSGTVDMGFHYAASQYPTPTVPAPIPATDPGGLSMLILIFSSLLGFRLIRKK